MRALGARLLAWMRCTNLVRARARLWLFDRAWDLDRLYGRPGYGAAVERYADRLEGAIAEQEGR